MQALKKIVVARIALIWVSLFLIAGCSQTAGESNRDESSWQEEFNLSERNLVTKGSNSYFILEPGFQLVLEGGKEKVAITVLDETTDVDGVLTRVVEEREWKNGKLVEVSRNFFAIDEVTNDVFYFGEEVDDYKDGEIIHHGGAWRAGQGDAKPGMMMPGQLSVGQKYYQEIAPGVAMDRAEIVRLDETLITPAGAFSGSLLTQETTPLNALERGYKTYAPGIGLIQDEKMLLTEYGFVNE